MGDLPFLPYARQEISAEDIEAVATALQSPFITQGTTVLAFEAAVASYVNASHCVAFSSGTAALHAAAFAVGVSPGNEMISTPITFAASTNAGLYLGAAPTFADINRSTWNLDPRLVAQTVTKKTKVIVPVSFAGLPISPKEFSGLGSGVSIIEDACHAFGAKREGQYVGGKGGADITTFSLHPAKVMTTGEGGLATTENPEFARRMRLFRTHGITRDGIELKADEGGWRYDMQALGFNYRITDFQCALGLSQLKRLDNWVEQRNEIAALYRELLQDEDRIDLPPAASPGTTHAYHLFVICLRASSQERFRVFEGLRSAGIGVQVHYIPVYQLSYYRDVLGLPQDRCPNAEDYYARAISLPMFPAMSKNDVQRVVRTLQQLLSH